MSEPLRVAVTQRVVNRPERKESRDALDQRWAPFLEACGLVPVLVPNSHSDPPGLAASLGVGGLLLTGGNNVSAWLRRSDGSPAAGLPRARDLAPLRDETEYALLRAALERGWPVIGVCRGMQVLNLFHGGAIRAVEGHRGTEHLLDEAGPGRRLFDERVNSYHDAGMLEADRAAAAATLARSGGVIEAFVHLDHPHLGIMWHPERSDPFSPLALDLFRGVFRRPGFFDLLREARL